MYYNMIILSQLLKLLLLIAKYHIGCLIDLIAEQEDITLGFLILIEIYHDISILMIINVTLESVKCLLLFDLNIIMSIDNLLLKPLVILLLLLFNDIILIIVKLHFMR